MIKITIININILIPYCDSHDFKYSALFVLNVQKQEKPDIRAFLQPWTFLKTIEIVSFVVSYVTGCHIFFHLGKSINTWTLNSIWLPYCLNYHQLQCRSSSINFSHHGPNFDTILTQLNVNISLFYAANNSHKKRPISHW